MNQDEYDPWYEIEGLRFEIAAIEERLMRIEGRLQIPPTDPESTEGYPLAAPGKSSTLEC